MRNDSSSGEEDGDEEWRSAINTISVDTSMPVPTGSKSWKKSPKNRGGGESHSDDDDDDEEEKTRPHNPYKLKVQKKLYDFLDKNLVMVKNPIPDLGNNHEQDEAGFRLFPRAPPGLTFKSDTVPTPRKRPKILPCEELHERSKEFKRRIRSVAVDGADVIAAAEIAKERALARFESKLVSANEAAKREEARVAELKRLRGEKWLPSMAKQMRQTF